MCVGNNVPVIGKKIRFYLKNREKNFKEKKWGTARNGGLASNSG